MNDEQYNIQLLCICLVILFLSSGLMNIFRFFFHNSNSGIQLFIVTSLWFKSNSVLFYLRCCIAKLHEWMNGYVSVYGDLAPSSKGILIWKMSASNTQNTHCTIIYNIIFMNLNNRNTIIPKETTHSNIFTTHYSKMERYETVCTHMCALQQWHTNLAQRKIYAWENRTPFSFSDLRFG